jgi:geranylgeranyl diphosphate synthase, type II
MNNLELYLQQFEQAFNQKHFPEHTPTLYNAASHILTIKGKRLRPVAIYLAHSLFDTVNDDTYNAGAAVELFHNFTLIHDDIMDKAPIRRGKPTVHNLYGENTALLAGDVVFVKAYEYLSKISQPYLGRCIELFNKTAAEVCEGQQLDMDFETKETVSYNDYVTMISLKTSVLVAASLQLGAILGGASLGNQQHLYEFGKNLGIAFQVQDDYLDAFGDPAITGKQAGGDILANKKTFLMVHTQEVANASQTAALNSLMQSNADNKVEAVLQIFKETKADAWAADLKEKYYQEAMRHLEEVAVLNERKADLLSFAQSLIHRAF